MNDEPREPRLQTEAMQRCQAAILNLVMVCYNIMLTHPAGWKGQRPVQLRYRESPTAKYAYEHLWAWRTLPEFHSVWERLAMLMDDIRRLPAGASVAALIRHNPYVRVRPLGVNRAFRRALVNLAEQLTEVPELGSDRDLFRLVWNNTMVQGLCILARDHEIRSATKTVLGSMFTCSMELEDFHLLTHPPCPHVAMLTEGSE